MSEVTEKMRLCPHLSSSVEIWKPVSGWESLYEVSNLGRVRSLSRVVNSKRINGVVSRRSIKGRLLKPHVNEDGYSLVSLCDNCHQKTSKIYRLVAEAFLSKNDSPLVRHLDGNPANNVLSNLAWGTYAENKADQQRHGRVLVGTAHHNCRLTADLVRLIRVSDKPSASLAREIGVRPSTIHSVRKRLTWRHIS